MKKKYTIAVAGTGYVGMSIAVLLAQHHKVLAVDIVPEKVECINRRCSPIRDAYIERYLAERELDLTATLDARAAYTAADFVVIAAPTNYDPKKNYFDTSAVEAVIQLVMQCNPNAIMVIKSTIPVGFTKSIREKPAATKFSLVRSFSENPRRFTIICIPAASLSVRSCRIPSCARQRRFSPRCCRRVR